MVMTNRTGSAKRFLEGHLGLVQQCLKSPNMFRPSVPAAAGSNLVESGQRTKLTKEEAQRQQTSPLLSGP